MAESDPRRMQSKIQSLERELISLDRNARVLISSGYSMNNRIKEALDLGAKGFMVKPYDIQELLDKVRLLADSGSSQKWS